MTPQPSESEFEVIATGSTVAEARLLAAKAKYVSVMIRTGTYRSIDITISRRAFVFALNSRSDTTRLPCSLSRAKTSGNVWLWVGDEDAA